MEEVLYARGCANSLGLVCQVLVNVPNTELIGKVKITGAPLGVVIDDTLSPEELQERYNNRFFVPSNPWYVPLCEQSVRTAVMQDGGVIYGSLSGHYAEHVAQCYRLANFDYRGLVGNPLHVSSISPDGLAVELAFLALLKEKEAVALESSQTSSEYHPEWYRERFLEFATSHTLPFAEKARKCLEFPKPDFYQTVASLAAVLLSYICGAQA